MSEQEDATVQPGRAGPGAAALPDPAAGDEPTGVSATSPAAGAVGGDPPAEDADGSSWEARPEVQAAMLDDAVAPDPSGHEPEDGPGGGNPDGLDPAFREPGGA